MIDRIDHIGIAVKDLAAAREFCERVLGVVCEGEEVVAEQGVRVAFFRLGEVRVELLSPLDGDGPVARFLARRGEGVHHLALRSDAIEEDLDRAAAAGCRLLQDEPRAGAGGKRIAFLHPASCLGVLMELCQEERDSAADH